MNTAPSILIVSTESVVGRAVALCSEAAAIAVAFGHGLDVALAREGDSVQAPEWVQVFPEGPEILTRDGRKYILRNPDSLVLAFQANRADLAADINHSTELLGPKGEPAPAQGWVKEIEHRQGQGVWARVDWNDEGKAALASRQYRYVSPAFRHNDALEITRMTSLALVTHPALTMPALAREGELNPQDKQMTTTLAARLAAALGLNAAATDDQLVEAATTHVALAREARDPTKLVPFADLQVALARADTAETAIATSAAAAKEAAAVTAVDEAVAAGKIAPAGKDHWLAIARENPDGFSQAMANQPVLTAKTDTAKDPTKIETDNHGLDADQLALCASMNIEPAAFAANLPKKAA